MKKSLSLFLAALFVLSTIPVFTFSAFAVDYDDPPTPSATWVFDRATGTVTISGDVDKTGTFSSSDYMRQDEIRHVVIENGIKAISDRAFEGCANLVSVTIPDTVTTIGDVAFLNTALQEIRIPASVTSIGTDAIGAYTVNEDNFTLKYESRDGFIVFGRPGSYAEEYVNDDMRFFGRFVDDTAQKADDYYYTVQNGKASVSAYVGTAASVTVPSVLGGAPVTSIGKRAFLCNNTLKNLRLPNTVETIGDTAFLKCLALQTVSLPNELRSIGKEAFAVCVSLKSTVLPAKLESIGATAFSGCKKLETVDFDAGLKSIGMAAFENCISLKEVVLDANIETIDDAFNECNALKTVIIASPKAKINSAAFRFCNNNLVLIGYVGSTTEALAKYRKINFYSLQQYLDNIVPTLSSAANTASGVLVQWKALAGSDSYTVYRKTGSGSWSRVATVGGSTTSYLDTSAKAGTAYTYTLRATNGSMRSNYNKKGVTVCRLSQPNFSAYNVSNGIVLKWNKIAGAVGYYIYRYSNGSWVCIGKNNSGSDTAFKDKNVKSGGSYKYTVRAFNGSSVSSYNKSGITIQFLSSPSITGIKSYPVGFAIYFTKVPGATNYVLYRKTPGSSWQAISNISSAEKNFSDTTGKKGVTYYYVVRAVSASSISALSSAVSAKR